MIPPWLSHICLEEKKKKKGQCSMATLNVKKCQARQQEWGELFPPALHFSWRPEYAVHGALLGTQRRTPCIKQNSAMHGQLETQACMRRVAWKPNMQCMALCMGSMGSHHATSFLVNRRWTQICARYHATSFLAPNFKSVCTLFL